MNQLPPGYEPSALAICAILHLSGRRESNTPRHGPKPCGQPLSHSLALAHEVGFPPPFSWAKGSGLWRPQPTQRTPRLPYWNTLNGRESFAHVQGYFLIS